jgi:hypothetical protein
MCKTVHFVVISAEIWYPHREEVVVLAIFSALSMTGGGGGGNYQQKFERSWRNSSR